MRSGLLTGLSTAAVSGSSALAGILLSRKFGHGAETDGFFAAYGVYMWWRLVHEQPTVPTRKAPNGVNGPLPGGTDPGDEEEDAELAAYNRYLARLNERDEEKLR